jgi:phosphatidylserine/phosphatidylglycerophosphate/cardiolipin synthase-like enzyme
VIPDTDANWRTPAGLGWTVGNSIELLIDNETAWGRLAEDLVNASASIRVMLFMLDIPHVRLAFDRPLVGNKGAIGSVRLEELLLAAAERGADVTVLINDVQPSISPANTTRAVETYFRRNDPARTVRLARLTTPQASPIHAKVIIVDDRVAYLLGSVFLQEYYDGRRHHIDDARRGHVRWRSLVRLPVHDVSARIEGPALADLLATFRLHWQYACPDDASLPADTRPSGMGDPPPADTTVPLLVTRTLHGGRYTGLPKGETGVYESYLRALEVAKDFVYVENQYLTCVEIVDAIVAAMLREPALQLICLMNVRLGIPGYDEWQREAIERLLGGLGPEAHRAGLFTLWRREPGADPTSRPVLMPVYVHSKVGIIDDAWLTVGSANLDGLSLLAGEHELRWKWRSRMGRLIGLFGSGDPARARSTEVNVVCAAPPGELPPAAIGALRRDLWAEHLGFDVDDDAPGPMALSLRPDTGWLSPWRDRADSNLADLLRNQANADGLRILPYPVVRGRVPPSADRPAGYLRALGVSIGDFDVRSEFRSFSFSDGRWP